MLASLPISDAFREVLLEMQRRSSRAPTLYDRVPSHLDIPSSTPPAQPVTSTPAPFSDSAVASCAAATADASLDPRSILVCWRVFNCI